MKNKSFIFHIGPQKSATTWIYRNLKEHPEICTTHQDKTHYYDMFYTKGNVWYASHFEANKKADAKMFDPTPTYIRSSLALKRIAIEHPNAKLALCMRNPIERAFSHYWHEKKKGTIHFNFNDVLNNYDLFANWIEPGFYAEHIVNLHKFFHKNQVLAQKFDDITIDPERFLHKLCQFYEIDPSFNFLWTHKKANAARPRQNFFGKLEQKMLHVNDKFPENLQPLTKLTVNALKKINHTNYEKLTDTDEDTLKALSEVCLPEIERLEKLLNIELNSWKKYG
jgi:hypothetical protein